VPLREIAGGSGDDDRRRVGERRAQIRSARVSISSLSRSRAIARISGRESCAMASRSASGAKWRTPSYGWLG